MPKSDEPRVERGQRIIREVQFEPDPELIAKVRFVRRPATLPADEHTGLAEASAVSPIDAATDAAEVPPTGSAWEAREEDDEAD
jgi:hypothetical protein